MKNQKKHAIRAAFCAGMLSLSGCTEPVSVYGPPSSLQTQSGMQSVTEEPQDVYGPPPADVEPEAAESVTSPTEEQADPPAS